MASLFVDWLLDRPFQPLCKIARTVGHRDYGHRRSRTRVVARRARSLVWSRPLPQPERDRNGSDVDPPPRRLVAIATQFAMMCATDGDRVFVADLSSERAGLGVSKMMRVGRRAAAHDARLAGYKLAMLLVAQANGLGHDMRRPGRISSSTSAKTSAPFAPCFDFDIGAVGASSCPTPFPFLDGGSATIFARLRGRARPDVFSGDADQREQRIPAGVSQRGSHPARGRRLADRANRPFRRQPFAGRMRENRRQSDQTRLPVDRRGLDGRNFMRAARLADDIEPRGERS